MYADPELERAHREEYEEVSRLAANAIESLFGVPAIAVRLLATALESSHSPLRRFALAIDYAADAVENGWQGDLARLKLARDLRLTDGANYDVLLGLLDGATAPPWPAIAEALVVLRDRKPLPVRPVVGGLFINGERMELGSAEHAAIVANISGSVAKISGSRAAATQQPARPKASGSTTTRGWGWEHQKERAKWARKVERGDAYCVRCGRPIELGPDGKPEPWDLGHDDHDRSRWTGPEHQHCNRSAGASQGNRRRSAEHTSPNSQEW